MRVISSRFLGLLFLLVLVAPGRVLAFQPFIVEEIRVEGLQRIAPGTVFNYLPVSKGDLLDEQASTQAIRELYRTGFFEDVVLEREGNDLVVFVEERPAIASVEITGNDEISDDMLKPQLEQLGLREGRIFDRSLLARVEQELQRQYLNLGKYAARIETQAEPLERNRVAVSINIREGGVATIRNIEIVGNQRFSDEELLAQFELGVRPPFVLFGSSDQYSRQKLSGDLESLRSYYNDRGYINFSITSTQVSITPDRQQVYVTVNVDEGDQYEVSEVKISGEILIDQAAVRELVSLQPGETFSRKEITASARRISEYYGEVGYAFANINPIPEVDEDNRTVALNFFIDPGQRVYVRRVLVRGNRRTGDEVVRREIRQMESSWLSTEKVKLSRDRLNRLGYFTNVSVETPPVAGSPDLVDVIFDVTERDTFGSLNLGVGYGDVQGFMVNAGIVQENFLGSGKRFSLTVDNSEVNTIYSFSLTEPYYTVDGVSRTLDFSYRSTDAAQANLAEYVTDTLGAGVAYGIPFSEYDTIRYGVRAESTQLKSTENTSQDIIDYITENGSEYNALRGEVSWVRDTRNRRVFPTGGSRISVDNHVAFPVTDQGLSLYKLSYRQESYLPLTPFSKESALILKGQFGYGLPFGRLSELPPFEKYYAGGVSSLRGYRANSLGPKDAAGRALGGDVQLLGSAELILPMAFTENSESTRLKAFIDGGNVYRTVGDIDPGQLRWSSGLALDWITPVGALSFVLAVPLNEQPGDDTESFQFYLGAPF